MSKVRYGIIGFGIFAEKSLLPAFRQATQSELIALHKTQLDAAKAKAAQYGIPYFYDSPEGLVGNPAIDAVVIASPNALHAEHTILAAQAGKHILCEKPMAMNVEECQQMIDACRGHCVRLMVAHMVRFSPLVRKIREVIQSGRLGRVQFARCDFMFDARHSPRRWIFDRALARGGPAFDIGVHAIDTLRYVLSDEVEQTSAHLSPPPDEHTVERYAALLLKFSRGIFATVCCSFELPYRTCLEITGSEGTLTCYNFTLRNRELTLYLSRDSTSPPVETVTVPVNDFYVTEIDHFSECLRQGLEPEIPGEEGLNNQRVLDAIYAGR